MGFELERSRAHGVLRVIIARYDSRRVFGDRVVEEAVGLGEAEFDGAFAGGHDLVEHREACRCRLRVVGVVDPLEAEDHIIGSDVSSVGELRAFADGRRPHGGITVGFEGLGELGWIL